MDGRFPFSFAEALRKTRVVCREGVSLRTGHLMLTSLLRFQMFIMFTEVVMVCQDSIFNPC